MTAVAVPQSASVRPVAAGIPTRRLVGVELRKMFDTRSGFWLMAAIVALAVTATGAVVLFAPDDAISYNTFAAAIGVPMSVILPMVAILSVTGEWTQGSGLTTFTLVPHRSRVIAAKAVAAVGVGVVSMLIAFAVGALGNVVGSAIAGSDRVWDLAASNLLTIVLANVLGMMLGFTLGVLLRSSAAAIVTYFVYAFVLPPLLGLLASTQQWFRHLQPWVDFNHAQGALYDGAMGAQQWGQLAVAGTIWLVVPLVAGLVLMRRAEVK
jgi:ABC-type transport system involved in multi-copper enzyme maturation permease subunit